MFQLSTLARIGAATTRAGTLAVAALALASCAGAQRTGDEIVWPLPPDKPRLKYVRSIRGAPDFETGLWSRFVRGVVGATGENRIINPSGIALSVDESIMYVASGPTSTVLAFDFARRKVRRFADIEGSRPIYPYAIAVDGSDRVYITDQKEAVVWVYSRDNKVLAQIGRGVFVRPTGIAVDRKRQLVYVVDPGTQKDPRHVVQVFSPDGRRLRSIGSKGADPGQLLFPTFAAVGPDGNLYVSDTLNARVQVFEPDGQVVNVIGTHGDALGQFAKPMGLAFDSLGNLHVADAELARVQIFDSKNQLLLLYGGKIALPPFMSLPNGLAITSKNRILVADYAVSHVNEYLLFDTSPQQPAVTPAAPPAAPK